METNNNYDKISRFYNFISGSFETRYREKALNLFSAAPGESLLEIGYGTGHSLIKLAESVGDSGHVLGIDSSQSMYKISLKKINRTKMEKRISLKCANVLEASYQENSFDGIFMSFTLETFNSESISQLLEKMKGWLRPGGKLCILSMAESEKKTLMYKMYLWSHRTFPSLVDCRPISPEKMLTENDFNIKETELMKIYNLPVKIVLAVNLK
jgi:ubiquinone/menaquinone biosynthesis C-methylase UbiE